ncbi:MAG: chromate transporter, partial [Chloroflexi bacterium]|nr:chromate transporter [Chloroflexota bacterium]
MPALASPPVCEWRASTGSDNRLRPFVSATSSAPQPSTTRSVQTPTFQDRSIWLGISSGWVTRFGGPVALVGYMQRDLVEPRRWFDDETYRLAHAFSQLMPGPLAVHLAITLSSFEAG